MFDFDPYELALRLPVLLLALTVHEFCHAWFAYRMGDPTAMRMGRCTLNPLKHLDPLGTICLLFAPIGWAKPVPINPINFRDTRKGILVSTAAGPLSNVAQALLWAMALRGVLYMMDRSDIASNEQTLNTYKAIGLMTFTGIMINTGLAIFNCLPLFPLDGFHIVHELQKPEDQERFRQTARLGPFVILAIVLIGNTSDLNILGRLIWPPVEFLVFKLAGATPEQLILLLT